MRVRAIRVRMGMCVGGSTGIGMRVRMLGVGMETSALFPAKAGPSPRDVRGDEGFEQESYGEAQWVGEGEARQVQGGPRAGDLP